jgi:c(7)-type cytochrome triheme protein
MKGGRNMKMVVTMVAVVITAVLFIGSAMAVPPGKSVEYAGGGAGKTVFDGSVHANKGLGCNDCHPSPFQMRKGSTEIKMEAVSRHKSCGACHDGTKAFKAEDKKNCVKCHQGSR